MKNWKKAGDLAVGTKVHVEQMSVDMTTLGASDSQVHKLHIGDRVTVDKGKRRERELIELVRPNGTVFRRVNPEGSVALGWEPNEA